MSKKKQSAFFYAFTPSPALAAIVGTKPLPRTEIAKKIWAYIKKNKLDLGGRMFKADAQLKAIGLKDKFHLTDVPRAVEKNLKK